MLEISPETITSWIDPREVIHLAGRLVTLASENPPGMKWRALQLGRFLRSAGLAVAYDYIEPQRPNLAARLDGNTMSLPSFFVVTQIRCQSPAYGLLTRTVAR